MDAAPRIQWTDDKVFRGRARRPSAPAPSPKPKNRGAGHYRYNSWLSKVPGDLRDVLQQMDFGEEGNPAWRGGLVLLASLSVGTNLKRLHAETGLPEGWIGNASWYLRRNEIWQRGGVMYYPWLEHLYGDDTYDLGVIGLILQAMVAAGDLIATPDETEGVCYAPRQVGDYSAIGVTERVPSLMALWREWRKPDSPHVSRRAGRMAAVRPT